MGRPRVRRDLNETADLELGLWRALVAAGLIWLVVDHWEWFATEPCGMESKSTTLRNLVLSIGAIIALGLAVWRGIAADRQAKASRDQAQTSQSSLLNERFQKGSEMIRSEDLSVRLTGIHELQDLAEDHPEQYHIKVMRRFCAFVRRPVEARGDKSRLKGAERKPKLNDYELSEDVQEVIMAISYRSNVGIGLEKNAKIRLNLTGAVLPLAHLPDAKLAGTDLSDAHFYPENLSDKEAARDVRLLFSRADLAEADLSGAFLFNANLTNAFLYGATLSKAYLLGANLTGATLNKAKGLTQAQLNEAVADPEKPPDLDDARDAETNKLLNWGGGVTSEFL